VPVAVCGWLSASQIGWANNIVSTGTCVHIVSANVGVLKLCGAHITGKEYIYIILMIIFKHEIQAKAGAIFEAPAHAYAFIMICCFY